MKYALVKYAIIRAGGIAMKEYIDVKGIRSALHMTQAEFAEFFDIKLSTLQKWERLGRTPVHTLRMLNLYMRLIGGDDHGEA